ncbi:NUDIX hydrolase [Rhizobiaceae bacterium n13]|uniref:NUDIX hydrolase n=1 Tax=Ferirhizobium litorale TaxID=2927786 RepID=A0AAE3U1T3_9HYPH|nr:NUDIX hydrolase [Fererhizobium litorale]MDI7863651.1 NUDIX hydrolase [Fererhizobium litorale]MDI7923379.1 NUDIX hydrolase [Fererhizobium litorale]
MTIFDNQIHSPILTADWPPEDTVFRVSSIDLRVRPDDHPFHLAQKAAAEANWILERQAKPALFDGPMVFQDRLSIRDGAIRGEGCIVPYSTFLWWRRQPAATGGFHVFGLPVPVSSDGAVIAIRMAEHTANPGKVYCPAGSFDPSDVVDGRCDVLGNMVREVREETGLDLNAAVADQHYHAVHHHRKMAILRCFRFALTAREMLTRIAAHMEVDEEKEIAGAVAIFDADPAAHAYSADMPPMLDWFFNQRQHGN